MTAVVPHQSRLLLLATRALRRRRPSPVEKAVGSTRIAAGPDSTDH